MKNPTRLVSVFVVLGAASFAIAGCEIVADFDRTKIDAGELPADGSTDALPATDASHDTGGDTTVTDGSADGTAAETGADTGTDAADTGATDAADTGTADAADAAQADADDGAADAATE